jgi:hypothetical protein
MRLEKIDLLTSRQKLPQGVFFKSKLSKEKNKFLNYLSDLRLKIDPIIKEDHSGIQISLIPQSDTWPDLQDTSYFSMTSELLKIDGSDTILYEIISAMLSSRELMIFPSYLISS